MKINGSDGPIRLSRSESAQLVLSLDNNGRTNSADWWLVAMPGGGYPASDWFWTPAGWSRTVRPMYQGPLVRVHRFASPPISLAHVPLGTYYFAFVVDIRRDGFLSIPAVYGDLIRIVVTE